MAEKSKRGAIRADAHLGVKLFQGYWFAHPSLVKATTIRPSQATIIQPASTWCANRPARPKSKTC